MKFLVPIFLLSLAFPAFASSVVYCGPISGNEYFAVRSLNQELLKDFVYIETTDFDRQAFTIESVVSAPVFIPMDSVGSVSACVTVTGKLFNP